MRYARTDQDQAVLRTRTEIRGGVLVGALLCFGSLGPLLAGSLDVWRLAGFLGLAGPGTAILLRAVSRPRSLRVDAKGRLTGVATGQLVGLELRGRVRDAGEAPRPEYQVAGELESGGEILLLRGNDPAEVMADARRLLETATLPVSSGWGLPPEASPWDGSSEGPATTSAGSQEAIRLPHPDHSRGAGLSAILGGLVTWGIWATNAVDRVRDGHELGILSVVLGTGACLAIVAVGAHVLRRHLRLEHNGTIRLESRGLIGGATRFQLDRGDLNAAWRVAPGSGLPGHVLLETRNGGLFSVPCDPERAAAIHEALRGS